MSMESIRIENMYDLKETIAAEIFEGKTYPWEVLPFIKEFIVKLGNTLDPEEYDKIGEDIWVAKSAKIAPTVALNGPCIIGKDAEVAVMGCVVNGPGEAREADIGIAGGKGEGLLIKKGEVVKKLPEDQLLNALHDELVQMQKAKEK